VSRSSATIKIDKDREIFLQTAGEACVKTDWEVHAWCLMNNHFHLVVETPKPNLVEGMKWFLGTYTSRFNRRHGLFGHLFSGRCKALVVDGSGNGYLKSVCDYVHLNPVRARLLSSKEKLSDYRWTATASTSNQPVSVAHGCGSSGCLESGEFPRIAWQAGRTSKR